MTEFPPVIIIAHTHGQILFVLMCSKRVIYLPCLSIVAVGQQLLSLAMIYGLFTHGNAVNIQCR